MKMCAATTASPSALFLNLNDNTTQQSRHSRPSKFSYSYYYGVRFKCSSSDDDDSKPKRGFGPPPSTSSNNTKKRSATTRNDRKKSSYQQSGTVLSQVPGLNLRPPDGKEKSIVSDIEFEERLQAVRRSALEQKHAEEDKQFGAIDYDAPVEDKSSTIGLGTKIGVGVAVIVFGLVFALGDFLPSGSIGPTEEPFASYKRISEEDRANLQARLQQFEATLASSPEDPTVLEGAAVTLAELGEYKRAASLLEDLAKKKPSDPDVFRLLGEVKYELKDYDGSATAYRRSAKMSKTMSFEVLRGLTNALLSAKKPDEAVQVLLASRARVSKENAAGITEGTNNIAMETGPEVDPIQVDLLLGKAYSDWGHVSDAVSVYDQLISSHPDDFRGYLGKGILLKENGVLGDAERMFIQARFFAPDKAKALVDKYAR